MSDCEIYDVILIGSGPANLFAAMELLKQDSSLSILLLERARRLNDSRNIANGWFGGSARAMTNMFLETNFGGNVADENSINLFVSRIKEYTNVENLKISKPKILKKTVKRLESAGIRLDEPTTLSLSEDRMIKLGDFLYKSLKDSATVLHKMTIKGVFKVNDHFEIHTNDGTYKGLNVLMGAGRAGAKWLNEINHNLELESTDSSFDLGIRLEFQTKALQELFSKTPYFRFKFGEFKTTVPTIQGNVETVELSHVKTSNGRSISSQKNYNANMGLLKTFQSKTASKDAYRLVEIVNVISDQQLMKESVSKFLSGTSSISPIPEYQSLIPGVRELARHFPMLAQKGSFYAPEARLNTVKYKLTKDMETEMNGLYIVGDMSGHTKSFVQAACSGINAARHIQGKR